MPAVPAPMPQPGAEIRILALGDSYTIGESVLPDERWPERLASLMRAAGFQTAKPSTIARTGWTTAELARGIDDALPSGPFDLVTLLIGVNDQYRGRDIQEYRRQFASLLSRAIGFAGSRPTRVLVLSIPDWGVTPFAADRDRLEIAAAIDAFNAINRRETTVAGARYVDITALSRRAAGDPSLVAGDGLHPSAIMHAEWARTALPVVLDMLSQSRDQ